MTITFKPVCGRHSDLKAPGLETPLAAHFLQGEDAPHIVECHGRGLVCDPQCG